jgi:hypothetical protein
VYQTTPSPALDVLHHQYEDAIHPELGREWSGRRDYIVTEDYIVFCIAVCKHPLPSTERLRGQLACTGLRHEAITIATSCSLSITRVVHFKGAAKSAGVHIPAHI